MREMFKEIHRLENEGDGMFYAGISELFRENAADPLTVIKLKQMIKILHRSQELVIEAIKLIPGFKGGDHMRDILKEIQSLENQGDYANREALAQLFQMHDKPIEALKWREIYDHIETAIDKCEDVADIVESILLEHF